MDSLTCPKCGNPWRSFERSGITVDQCTGCRGVFLDRGELERLIESETRYADARGYARAEELGYGDRYRDRFVPHMRHDDDDDEHGHHGYTHGRRRHRERGGFLEDFFGGDD